jgi:hypothetical protein
VKDLDFDELDRAVNSLIAKPSDGSVDETPMAPALDQNLTDDSVMTQQDTNNNLPMVPEPVLAPAVTRPSTGRFMDVVHPSSDMRTSLTMPERTSTQNTESMNPRPTMAQVTPIAPPQMHEPVAPVVPEDSYSDRDEDADIDRLSNDIANTLGQKLDESSDSPFLPDTKVEKRPLGAFSTDPMSNSASQTAGVPAAETEKVEEMPAVKPVEAIDTPLPAELQNDLLSIESDSTTQPEALVPTNESIADNQPVASNTPATSTLSANTSIQQQYKEQPSSGDQNNGAIYDTKAYHKAVHPTHKTSGWMWVLWITILIIVGAGAGVAVYFLVLPHL